MGGATSMIDYVLLVCMWYILALSVSLSCCIATNFTCVLYGTS
jgi:hypothetical protein